MCRTPCHFWDCLISSGRSECSTETMFKSNQENVLADRFLNGIGEAASWSAIMSVMMKLYPDNVASILSWTDMVYGLGYSLGPAIGGVLYDAGGIKRPFCLFRCIALIFAIALIFLIPGLKIKC